MPAGVDALHYFCGCYAFVGLRFLTPTRVSLWAGKKDLRGLLASLPSIWSSASVSTFPASLYNESVEGKVKKAYMQALRLVHPDKLPANTVRSPPQLTVTWHSPPHCSLLHTAAEGLVLARTWLLTMLRFVLRFHVRVRVH